MEAKGNKQTRSKASASSSRTRSGTRKVPPTEQQNSSGPYATAVVRMHSEEKRTRAEIDAINAAKGQQHTNVKRKEAEVTSKQRIKGVAADFRRVAFITFACGVLVFCLIAVVGVKWTTSSNTIGTDSVDRPGAGIRTEIGLFKICNCSTHDLDNGAAVSCPSIDSYTRGVQATSILALMLQGGGFLLFLVTTYISLNKKLELGMVFCWGFAALLSLMSWALWANLYTQDGNTHCSGATTAAATGGTSGGTVVVNGNSTSFITTPAPTISPPLSYKEQGLALSWAFGFRIIESFLGFGVVVLLAARWKGKVGIWPLALSMQLFILMFSAATTSSNNWIHDVTASSGTNVRVVGPWNDCRCWDISVACPDVTPQFRGAGAFGVLTVLLLIVQVFLASTVPSLLPQVPEVAVMIFAWATWLFMCVACSIGIAALTDCRCGVSTSTQMQHFNWPLPVAFCSFLAQTWVGVFVSYQYGKKRLLLWASDLHRRADGHAPGMEADGGGGGDGEVNTDSLTVLQKQYEDEQAQKQKDGALPAARVDRVASNVSSNGRTKRSSGGSSTVTAGAKRRTSTSRSGTGSSTAYTARSGAGGPSSPMGATSSAASSASGFESVNPDSEGEPDAYNSARRRQGSRRFSSTNAYPY